jgi:hypothetical protein
MTMPSPDANGPQDDAELQAPAALIEALARRHNQRVFVPPPVEAAILAAARARLQHGAPVPSVWRRCAPWAALAASVTLVLWLARTPPQPSGIAAAAPDINEDGCVDILDALVLAHRLEQGTKSGGEHDVNGDGVVDRQDAEALARKSVRLGKGGGA